MAQLQYIGARYVPIWYQNSVDGTANWEINVEYEPLTWVTTQNNHLYLSKKTVPDNIGTPAQNTDYWLDMGVITGNVQNIQDQIDAIVANIGSLSDLETTDKTSIVNAINEIVQGGSSGVATRNIVFYGDSYGETYQSGGITITGWVEKMSSVLPSNITVDLESQGISGYGFCAADSAHRWIRLFENDDPRDDVTDVVFVGGHNDVAYSVTDPSFPTAITATIAAAKTKFPKAKIWVGFCSIELENSANTLKGFQIYNDYATAAGAIFMPSIANALYNMDYVLNHAHPNNDGTSAMARAICTCLLGGEYKNIVPLTQATQVINTTDVKTVRIDNLFYEIEDNILKLDGRVQGRFQVRYDEQGATGIACSANGGNPIILSQITNLPVNKLAKTLGSVSGVANFSNIGFVPVSVLLCLQNEFLTARVIAIDNGNYINGTLLSLALSAPRTTINLTDNMAESA